MAARPATAVEELRQAAHYIDAGLQPTLNELPGLFAALVEGQRLPEVADKIEELRSEGAGDVEIRQQVAHVIAPPDPDAGAVHVQGVPPEQVAQLQSELADLRQLVSSLHAAQAPPTGDAQVQQSVTEQQSAQQEALDAQQQELQELRELVQRLSIANAAGQHPTVTNEPADTTPPNPVTGEQP